MKSRENNSSLKTVLLIWHIWGIWYTSGRASETVSLNCFTHYLCRKRLGQASSVKEEKSAVIPLTELSKQTESQQHLMMAGASRGHLTMYVPPRVCTLPHMYHAVYVAHRVCSPPSMYHSVYEPLRLCTTPYMYHVVYVPRRVCTTPCMYHGHGAVTVGLW